MGQDGLLMKILYIESCSKHAMQNNPGARAQPASLLLNSFTGIRREKLFPGDLQFRPLSPKHALVAIQLLLLELKWTLVRMFVRRSGQGMQLLSRVWASVASVQLVWGEGTAGFAAAANTGMNTPAHSRYDSSASAMEGSLSIGDGE